MKASDHTHPRTGPDRTGNGRRCADAQVNRDHSQDAVAAGRQHVVRRHDMEIIHVSIGDAVPMTGHGRPEPPHTRDSSVMMPLMTQ